MGGKCPWNRYSGRLAQNMAEVWPELPKTGLKGPYVVHIGVRCVLEGAILCHLSTAKWGQMR